MSVSIALYRRYRPETFQEVIGQDHVIQPLMAALEAGRTTHAYLFSGPRGCGKTTSARILARALNCVEYPTPTPCGTCDSCVELARDGSGSLDVVEMDAASHGGVDDARELREQAGFAPVRDRFKIFIIDEAHMVTNQGFNALLKLVEEPPEHVKFIFATTEPEKVIGTIRSRTHHYPFRLVPPGELEAYLAKLLEAEGMCAGHDLLSLVVRAGTGSVRDTLSVLDQIMGGSEGSVLDYDRAVALLGYTSAHLLDDAVAAIAARDGAALFGVVDAVVKSGHDPRRFVEDLLQRLRDLVIMSLTGDEAKDVFVSVPDDQYSRMVEQATKLGAQRASYSADLTNEALAQMAGATAPRLQLELLCARLVVARPAGAGAASGAERSEPQSPSPEVAASLAKYQQSEGARRQQAPAGGGSRSASTIDPRHRPMPSIPAGGADGVAASAASETGEGESGKPDATTPDVATRETTGADTSEARADASDPDVLGKVAAQWPAIMADPGLSRIAVAQLDAAIGPVALEGASLVIGFEQPGVANAFTARGARELQELLATKYGMNVQVEGRVGGEPVAPKASAAQVAAHEPHRQHVPHRHPAGAPGRDMVSKHAESEAMTLGSPQPAPADEPHEYRRATATADAFAIFSDDADEAGTGAAFAGTGATLAGTGATLADAGAALADTGAPQKNADAPAAAASAPPLTAIAPPATASASPATASAPPAVTDTPAGIYDDFPMPPPLESPFDSPQPGAGAKRSPQAPSAHTVTGSWAPLDTRTPPPETSNPPQAPTQPEDDEQADPAVVESNDGEHESHLARYRAGSATSANPYFPAAPAENYEDAGESEPAASPPPDHLNPEWEGASADDPEISQSSVVGLRVVLERFDAKVIEERSEE